MVRILFDSLGQAKIRDSQLIVPVNQNNGRFQVTMQDTLFIGVMNCPGDLLHVLGRLLRRQRTLADDRSQTLALDVVHREIVLTLVYSNFMDCHNS